LPGPDLMCLGRLVRGGAGAANPVSRRLTCVVATPERKGSPSCSQGRSDIPGQKEQRKGGPLHRLLGTRGGLKKNSRISRRKRQRRGEE